MLCQNATLARSFVISKTLANDPTSRSVDVKNLQPKNTGQFRLRAGRWRAIFVYNRATSSIEVLRVDDRRDAY